MKLIGKITSYEKIVAYMRDKITETELTDHEKELIVRWNEAFTLLRNYESTADTAAILMKRFNISRATAYRDCSSAVSLFGNISQATKEGIRHLCTEITRDAIAMARQKNDQDSMIRGANSISVINALNVNDPEKINLDEFEPHNYSLTLDPASVSALKNMISGGRVDLCELVDNMAGKAEEAIVVEDLTNDRE